MNTKVKARVIGAVCRPIGILPLDPRPKQNRRISKTKSNNPPVSPGDLDLTLKLGEKKPGKESRSSNATRSLGSIRSRSGSSSRSKAKVNSVVNKRSGSAVSDVSYYASDSDDDGQDVKFFNVSSSRSSRPSNSLDGPVIQKTIDPQEILSLNHEKDFSKVYEIIQHGEEITDISHLQQFKRLKILDLSCNRVDKITGLDENTDLKELKLYDNKIKLIENLDSLKDLSCLQLQHNKIKLIGKGLNKLKKLKTLRLDSNQILKLETSDFISCVQLTSLDLSYNIIDNLSALNYLPNLEELSASGNRLRNITDLNRCKKLVELDLSNNRISDISGFNKLPNLQILKLSNNQISCLTNVGRLKSLEELDLSGNKVSELSTLSMSCPSLQILNISDNEITSWQEVITLSKIKELVEVFISGNPFSEENGEKLHYFAELQKLLTTLEILDGAHIKKSTGKSAVPLMRPMSASTVVSIRQMDNQLKSVSQELSDLQNSISQRFESIRTTCLSLPTEAPPPSTRKSPVPTPSNEPAEAPPPSTRKSPVPTPSNEPDFRPKSSSRMRIRQAQEFAASQKFS